MAVNLSPLGGVGAQFFDSNGNPLSGGLIYTYAAGTNTPQATYTSSSGIIQHSNPIVLDAAGRVPTGEIWLTDGVAYKFVIQTSAAVLVGTYDNIVGINSNFVAYTSQQEIQTATAGQTVFDLTTMQYQPGTNNLSVFVDGVNQYGPGAQYAFVETDSDTITFVSGLHEGASVKFTTATPVASAVVNAENVAYDPPFFGSVTTNVELKLAQTISVKDFGAVGDGVTDDSTAIQNAINAISATGGVIEFESKNYAIATGLVIQSNNIVLRGNNGTYFGNIGPDGLGPADPAFFDQYGGTILTWIGSSGVGDMLTIAAPDTGPAIQGCGIEGGLLLNGASKALRGFVMISHRGGDFGEILVADCQTRQFEFNCYNTTVSATFPIATWTSIDPGTTQHNHFQRITASCWNQESAEGILISGNDVYDTSANVFHEIDYIHKNGIGLNVKSSGANVIHMVFGYRKPSGTAVGVQLNSGQSVADDPVTNYFGWVQTGAGGFVCQGTADGILPPKYNSITAYSLGNGSPATPTVHLGGDLTYRTEWGANRVSRLPSFAYYDAFRSTNTNNSPIGEYRFAAYNSAGSEYVYGYTDGLLVSNTAGSETGQYRITVPTSGTNNVEVKFGNGIQVGVPTGGAKGVGTINTAGDIYKNNSAYTNPDYVFEYAYTGQIVKFASNEGAANYSGKKSIDEIEQITKETLRLPGFTDEPSGAFARFDLLLEKLEEAYLCIFELNNRIKQLEK
jgi:hypothetical protein